MKYHQTRVEGRAPSAGPAKRYEPVREFERQTSYCPLYLAWRIVDEARNYFRTEIPESYARILARRAEAVFAHHPSWARKASPRAGTRKALVGFRRSQTAATEREFILKFMRHWLAGVLARERPALFRALPESFKVGHPLPMEHIVSVGRGYRRAGSRRRLPHPRFVHGCELLPA
jgi:hypothetical protein